MKQQSKRGLRGQAASQPTHGYSGIFNAQAVIVTRCLFFRGRDFSLECHATDVKLFNSTASFLSMNWKLRSTVRMITMPRVWGRFQTDEMHSNHSSAS
jgi:Ni2+-binding GTPase involved in maturation of urease and hydrogenase